jgi:hypothetical protein
MNRDFIYEYNNIAYDIQYPEPMGDEGCYQ